MIAIDDFLIGLSANRVGVFLLSTVIGFWKKRARKNIETDDKLIELRTKELQILREQRYFLNSAEIPLIRFEIEILKKLYGTIEPQKLLVNLYCNDLFQRTYYWYRGCSIDDVEIGDLKAVGDGYINIDHMVLSPYPSEWKLKGNILFHHKFGDISKEIDLTFPLDEGKNEVLRKIIPILKQALKEKDVENYKHEVNK